MSHVLYEVEESETTKRGGKVVVNREIYILRPDLSQTVINLSFDKANPEDVQIDQHDEATPRIDAAILKSESSRFGPAILSAAQAKPPSTVAGVKDLLKTVSGVLPSVGSSFGVSIYENFGASARQTEELRPGDIVVFDNAKLQGSKSPLQKYHRDVNGSYVLSAWDGAKKKLHLVDSKKDTVRLNDLRSGSIRIYRVVGRDLLGWE